MRGKVLCLHAHCISISRNLCNFVAMNVKVKMPRFGRPKNGTSMTKELVMSVIGTTISILLTFGTAHLIEQHQRKAEGRDVAMMVIHDIDLYAASFRTWAEEETKNHDLAMYVLEHIDSIQSIPIDTIASVVSYLTYEDVNSYQFDENIEKTFQSNQEIWRSIDAPPFIDEARSFFHDRRLTFQMLNTSARFRKPLGHDEVLQMFYTALKSETYPDWNEFLRKKLQNEEVQMYIQLHDQRLKAFNATADNYQDMSNRCKFIMNISDEELDAFVDKRKRAGKLPTDRQMIGLWSTQGDEQQSYEFRKDHTFTQNVERRYPSPAFHGRLKVIYIYTGRWEIKNDSLYRYFDAGYDFKIDRSSITYSPEKREEVEQMLKQYEENMAAMVEQQKDQSHETIVRAAAIDRTGNKVELTYPENDPNGRNSYLIRERAEK